MTAFQVKPWGGIHERSYLNLSLISKTFLLLLDKKLMTFVVVLEQFTKGFSLILVISLVITLRLGGSGPKYLRPLPRQDNL